MTPNPRTRDFPRAGFESFEDRLALSAQALVELPQPLDAAHIAQQSLPSVIEPLAKTTANQAVDLHGWTDVDAVRQQYGLRGQGQTVAVIDSGIAYDQIALGGGFGPGHKVVGGYDFALNTSNPYDFGPAGFHGTHVSGIIAAKDGKYPGVAPDADLVALRVFDNQGNGNFNWIDQALQWVHTHRDSFQNPITTVNLSLGADWNSTNVPNWGALENDFQTLAGDGIFIAVAAGNSFAKYHSPGVSYPAASPYVVPVASVGASGNLSSFSQRDSRVLAAPGERITSTLPNWFNGGDGTNNDWGAASGTSMAAPYVAGASVLAREAMLDMGRTNIQESDIYNLLYDNADLVYDSATLANYHRVNLQRTLSAIVGADDFGSTINTATSIGTLSRDSKISGVMGQVNDQDYFQFTAGVSGKVTFNITTTGEMAATWLPANSGGAASGNQFSLRVAAGQTYTIGIGTSAGIGKYNLNVHVAAQPAGPAAASNWGVVSFAQIANQNLSGGDAWFQVIASRTGVFTAQTFFQNSAGNVDLEILDSQRQLLASSRGAGDSERCDFSATAGGVYYVHTIGANANVSFQLTNLVVITGNNVVVNGTDAADTFTWSAGAPQQLSVNGVQYSVAGNSNVVFHGGQGSDSITITGGPAAETATLKPGLVTLVSGNYQVTADNVESIRVIGGAQDTALFYDSAGDDNFTASPLNATMSGAGYTNIAIGFQRVSAFAIRGGNNTAVLNGSAGDDTLVIQGANRILTGVGFQLRATGFQTVRVNGNGGKDQAQFYDLTSSDTVFGRGKLARLTAAGVTSEIYDFSTVIANNRAGQKAATDVQTVDYLFRQIGSAL